MNDNKDILDRLADAVDNLNKVVAEMNKTMNKMINFCGLMLLALFGVTALALLC